MQVRRNLGSFGNLVVSKNIKMKDVNTSSNQTKDNQLKCFFMQPLKAKNNRAFKEIIFAKLKNVLSTPPIDKIIAMKYAWA